MDGRKPISPTFARRVQRCRKCGSRILTNISHCPFCGKAVYPFFKRLWFWLIVLVVVSAGTFIAIRFGLPMMPNSGSKDISAPIVIGAPEGTPYKNLPLGATVDCNSLLVTVTNIRQDQTTSDGTPIYSVEIQFYNKASESATIYSTQWQMQGADGTRKECYIGKTKDGTNLKSEIDAQVIRPDGRFSATLYFSGSNLTTVLYSPDALSYTEGELVIWVGSTTTATPPPDEVLPEE
jgi:hypothetical protein